MTLFTQPPDFFVGAGRDTCRDQGCILRGVPLFGEAEVQGLKAVVFACAMPRAIRTASIGSLGYFYLPFVSFTAYPPDFFP